MRKIIASGAALLALSACDVKKNAATAPEPAAELGLIANDYLGALIDASPFLVVYAGVGDVVAEDHAAMEDNSPAALDRFRSAEDAISMRLNALTAAPFTGADWVLFETMREAVEANRGLRVCNLPLWGVNHMSGWQNSFPQVANGQAVETAVERSEALARWRRLPAYLKQEEQNLATGLAQGYSGPKRVVRRVIAQLDSIIAAPAEQSPFLSFAAKAEGDAAFAAAAKTLAADEIAPAVVKFRDFLRDKYLPAAREELSIKAIPNGEECYEALLRTYHTAAIGARGTYDKGQKTVVVNKAAVIERGEAMFGESDFATILKRVKDEPSNRFQSEADQIAMTREFMPTARAKVAPFFKLLPEQDLIVEPFPDFLKGTGQSSRYEPKPASEGSATYQINTDDWKTQTRGEAEIVAVHEGWPGHHLQIATAYALKDLHPITRILGSTAYIEGWARYAEGLAEEAGLYESGYGAITRRAWPARGMVLDPGLHLYGWTNEQVKAFAIESGRFDEESADVLLDRIAVIPGQLTAYDTGGLEFAALRADAMKRLGARFDIQAFHERALENGAVPLAALRAHVEEWIAAEEKN